MLPTHTVHSAIERVKICPVKIERVGAALANALKEMFPTHTVHSAIERVKICPVKIERVGWVTE
jgi:hypothetical protein